MVQTFSLLKQFITRTSFDKPISSCVNQLSSIYNLNQIGKKKRVKCHFSPYGLGYFVSLVQRFHFSPVDPKRFYLSF
ncbi:hypothetical protein Hanom_Chr09g00804101 [Helianthus anomalus]